MAKTIAKEDCGNAPKKKFILDFLTALTNRKFEAVLDMLDDDAPG